MKLYRFMAGLFLDFRQILVLNKYVPSIGMKSFSTQIFQKRHLAKA